MADLVELLHTIQGTAEAAEDAGLADRGVALREIEELATEAISTLTASPAGDDPKALDAEARSSSTDPEGKVARIMANPCAQKLAPGEPFFILLGRDKNAAEAVAAWSAARRRDRGTSQKTDEADALAAAMDAYRGDGATRSSSTEAVEQERPTGHFAIDHDGFAGTVIGHYTTLEGKQGVVLQQDGTRVVHVYGEKWLKPADAVTGSLPGAAVEQEVERLRAVEAAAQSVLTDWTKRLMDGEEKFIGGEYGPFWSPHASMVTSEKMAALRAAIARPSPVPAACKPEGETHG